MRPMELRQFAEVMGVSRRRVQSWAEGEFVRPYVHESPGSRRQFWPSDIMRAALVMRLQALFGIKTPLAGRAVQACHEWFEAATPKLELAEMPDSTSVVLAIVDDGSMAQLDTVEHALRIDLTPIVVSVWPVLRDVLPRLEERLA